MATIETIAAADGHVLRGRFIAARGQVEASCSCEGFAIGAPNTTAIPGEFALHVTRSITHA